MRRIRESLNSWWMVATAVCAGNILAIICCGAAYWFFIYVLKDWLGYRAQI